MSSFSKHIHRSLWPGLAAGLILAAGFAALRPAGAAKSPAPEPQRRPQTRGVKIVTFTTSDGWHIVGDLYAPSGASQGAVILLHQRGGRASDWRSLSRALQAAGLTALAIDQRGAGRSTQGPGKSGDDAPWPTSKDIEAAVAFVQGKGNVGLAGASYGANNALIYAADHADQIKSLALYSPGADYHGLNAIDPAKKYKNPMAIYHDRDDTIAGDGPDRILNAQTSPVRTLRVLDGSAHGTALLSESTVRDTTAFFVRTLK